MSANSFLVTFLLLANANGLMVNYCMNYEPYCECRTSEKIECHHVRDLSRLSFRAPLNVPDYKRIDYMCLEAAPSGLVRLDSTLQLDSLAFDSKRFQLILANFGSIELEASLFSRAHLADGLLPKLFLTNFSLTFLYRGKAEFDWICDLVVGDTHLRPLFSSFKVIFLGVPSPIFYPPTLCPAIFKHAHIDSLYLHNLTDRNRPRFVALNQESSLNSIIRSLHIQASQIPLDARLVDPHVFRHLEKLSVEFSSLAGIEPGALAPLKHLRHLNLRLDNLAQFLRSSQNEWLADLNVDAEEIELLSKPHLASSRYVSRRKVYVELNDEKHIYGYPDEDFCLFKFFPHSKLVFAVVSSAPGSPPLNCTCTLAWLVQFWRYSLPLNIRTPAVMGCFESSANFSEIVHRCDFDARLEKCFQNATGLATSGTISAYLKNFLVRRQNLVLSGSVSSSISSISCGFWGFLSLVAAAFYWVNPGF